MAAIFFADDISNCIILSENVLISITISLKFVPKGPIINILALVQIMAWRRPDDTPSELLLTAVTPYYSVHHIVMPRRSRHGRPRICHLC